MTRRAALIAIMLAAPAMAQLGLPQLPQVGNTVDGLVQPVADTVGDVVRDTASLAQARIDRLAGFARANRATVELDDTGAPARRGEVLIVDPSPDAIAKAQAQGFAVLERGEIDGLGVGVVRLGVPKDVSLGKAVKTLRMALPGSEVTADQLHFKSGAGATPIAGGPGNASVGLIDGGTATPVAVARGFATGAPLASAHGTTVATILAKNGAPRIYSADVYGRDPAGGNALAIARALGWMAESRVGVVNVSLVGPPGPLLARSIAAARARGVIVVAAVGNDGPAAPPAYPASYAGVIAVTGVDARRRPLIEAGRALHLDYAAPGIVGRARGTSFAAPFVSARLAQVGSIAVLDREAIDLGPKGPDAQYGRGLICADCPR